MYEWKCFICSIKQTMICHSRVYQILRNKFKRRICLFFSHCKELANPGHCTNPAPCRRARGLPADGRGQQDTRTSGGLSHTETSATPGTAVLVMSFSEAAKFSWKRNGATVNGQAWERFHAESYSLGM